MSTTENALTAHLVCLEMLLNHQEQKIDQDLKNALEYKNIHHITLQTERENELCKTETC